MTGAALTALAVAAAVPALGAYYAERNPAPDIPLAARSIQALARPGDVVILNPGRDWPVFRYYAPGVADWLVIEPTDRLTDERASDLLSRVAAENSGAWLVTSRETASVDPGAAARTWLERNYRDAGGYSAGQTEVRLFTPDAARRLAPDAMPGRLAGITPTTRLYVADGIPPAVRHGEQWPLLLGWERDGDAGVASVRLSLVSNEGRGFPGRRQNLPAGARAVTPLTLAVTDSIPPGRYQLNVDLMQGDLVETTFGLGWTTVQGGLSGRNAAVLVDVGAVFGGQIELAGYRAEIGADGQLVLDLAWRATDTPPDVNYTVFVHLVDGEDRRVDQRDRQPQEGRAPTSAWQPGAAVIDSYRFPWTLERRDRGVRAVVGLYLPTTGQRLELAGGGTSVDLPLP
jgi:hypothetical protein